MKSVIYVLCLLITMTIIFRFFDNEHILSDIMQNRIDHSIISETDSERETPVETMSFSGTKKDPAAIPVVTPKEAETLNEKALEYALKTDDPFYSMYKEQELETVSFEATILATSIIPDPAKNDYENCLYAILVEVESVFSTTSLSKSIEHSVLVNTPIMKDKKIIPGNKFKAGDKIFCKCAEYDAMPQGIQEIQLSDDIQSFELQQYYSLTIKKIKSFQETGNKQFAKREISILPIQSLPKDDNAASSRRDRIQKEIHRIENELTNHGGSFAAWKEEYKYIADKYNNLCKEKYKGWINDSYFAAGGKETTYKTKEYIDGILPYKRYLEENNIDLIVVRIPSKGDFAARVLASEKFQENPSWVEHYYECLKNDIEIIDPMPEMWKERFDFPLFYYYQAAGEPHPCEGTAFCAAKVLSIALKQYSFAVSTQKISLDEAQENLALSRSYWPQGNERFDPKENIVFKQVIQNGKTIGNLSVNSGSPFLFLSNSFFWHPHRSLGASVPGYTAYFIQAVPDWFYQEGTHNPMIRNLVARPQLLNSRRAVIMVGHPDDWKEFPPIPKYIQEKARRITLEKTINAFSDEITIQDNNSFLYSIDKNDAVLFAPSGKQASQNTNRFEMSFKIPYIDGKKTCMIRVNFDQTAGITLNLRQDNNDTIIDTSSLPSGRKSSADLFVPLSDHSCEVKILFQPKHYDKEYSVRDIELWYY